MQKNILSTPIPLKKEIPLNEVYSIPIVESNEELIPLSLAPEYVLVRSIYFEARIEGALPECYARLEIQNRLMQAAKLLPKNLRLVVLDSWRNPKVQKTLFTQCKTALSSINPNIEESELNIITQQYVSLPSTNKSAPSPHSTGGAVDVIIATKNGIPLFFGSPFDYPTEISHTRYFEKKVEDSENLSKEEITALQNRRLLYNIMKEVGFVNLSSEWWHFEYGTQRHAIENKKQHAIYGATNLSLNSFEAFFKDI